MKGITSLNKILLVLVFLLLLLLLFQRAKRPEPDVFKYSAKTPVAIDLSALQEGDLILRRGSSFVSAYIAQAFPEAKAMSHGGILIFEDNHWQVVHSISGLLDKKDGIRSEALTNFLAEAEGTFAYHISPRFEISQNDLAGKTREYLMRGACFDHDFDLETRDKLYCTELLRSVYLECGAPDIFLYKEISGRKLVDLASFFEQRYWQVVALPLERKN